MHLRLTTPSNGHFMRGHVAKLELDGVDVSKYVTRVLLDVDAEGALSAEVTFYLTGAEVDVDAVIRPLIKEAERSGVLGGGPVQVKA